MSRGPVTILGLGNILLQDEGFGVRFVSWFAGRYHLPEGVRLIDGGTLGYGLLDTVCSCERLIVIDVIKVDDEPGSLYRFDRNELDARMPEPTSAHEVEFLDLLVQAEILGACPEVVFLCIVPHTWGEMDLEMSPVMGERFPEMEGLLLQELARLDVKPERLPRCTSSL